MVTMVEAHAEGEIGRIVTGGVPSLPGKSILETLNWLNGDGEKLRRFLVFEPRGYAQMSTCLLLPAKYPEADIGFVIMQADKTHAMSGSNTICLSTVLLECGHIPMTEPISRFTLDTASGLVDVEAECADGACKAVKLRLAGCYADQLDAELEVEGIGPVRVDIAFGGIFYALVDAASIGLEIRPENARRLVSAGSAIHRAVNSRLKIAHPDYPGLEGISYVMFTAREVNGDLRGATIMPPGRVDRSPCGTGNAARLAVMAARGEAGPGDEFIARSIIDSRFDVRIADIRERDGHPMIIPEIRGRGWIYGMHQIGLDPDDPYPEGFQLTDCWGDAHDLLR